MLLLTRRERRAPARPNSAVHWMRIVCVGRCVFTVQVNTRPQRTATRTYDGARGRLGWRMWVRVRTIIAITTKLFQINNPQVKSIGTQFDSGLFFPFIFRFSLIVCSAGAHSIQARRCFLVETKSKVMHVNNGSGFFLLNFVFYWSHKWFLCFSISRKKNRFGTSDFSPNRRWVWGAK